MFDLNEEIISRSRRKFLQKKETIPVGSMLKWMDPRIIPLKLSDFLKQDFPFIVDLPVFEDKEPYDIAKKYLDMGFRAFSVSTNPYWNDGYDDFISFLKRSKQKFEYPIIRRDLFFETYQLIETRLFLGDSFTIFPSLVEGEKLEIIMEDAENLEFKPIVVVTNDLDLKLLKKVGGDYFIALAAEKAPKFFKKSKKMAKEVIVYSIKSVDEINSLKMKGLNFFWVSWKFVEANEDFFKSWK